MIARAMRVCAYDRAGYGFSDAGPMPRDLEAEAGDLHLLVQAAHIATPAIFVGHSMGTNLIRRYDQLHPGDVAAMVLVDPPPQHIAEFSPAYAKVETEMAPAMFQAYRNCEQGAKDGQLATPPPALQNCLRGPNPGYSDALNAAIRANHSTPAFWASMISGAEAKTTVFEAPVAADETHGDKPLLVLTAAKPTPTPNPAIARRWKRRRTRPTPRSPRRRPTASACRGRLLTSCSPTSHKRLPMPFSPIRQRAKRP